MDRPRVGVIGTGRVGTAFAVALDGVGYPVVAGWSRSSPALNRFSSLLPTAKATTRPMQVVEEADVVFLTVPDSLVAVLAQSLSWDETKTALHCSGVLSTDVLAPAAAEGAATGSLHPLLPIASPKVAFAGAVAAIEGDERALPLLRQMANDLGLRPLAIASGDKALYHAAATLLSNYTVTLFALSTQLFEALGFNKGDAREGLLALLRGVEANLGRAQPDEALTGPIKRGDVDTVRRHLDVLAAVNPEVERVYRELGKVTVAIALQDGAIDEARAVELSELLKAEHKEEVPV